MFNKFRTKKGNITIILIGVISVMVLMTAALSRRMSGHTQLLMLSDYTQISRYFLETYMSAIMQQFREEVRDPNSAIAKTICSNISGEKDLSGDFHFKPELKQIVDELAKKYNPEIKYDNGKPKIKLTKETKPIGYPKGICPKQGTEEIEKIGSIELVVTCEFNKRKYSLKVQYPFSVVYRLTPIIKDFIVFADNIYEEQRADVGVKDKINLLRIESGAVKENIVPSEADISGPIKPFVLIGDPNFGSNPAIGSYPGSVYFGPSDKAIYLNLAGITPRGGNSADTVIDGNEMFLVSPEAIGLGENDELLGAQTISFPLGVDVKSFGSRINNLVSGHALVGVMGFCKEFSELFDGANRDITEFFGKDPNINDTYWSKILESGKWGEYLSFASGIKVFGFKNPDDSVYPPVEPRNIYGNVFARFLVLTFWNPGSAQGQPLEYSQNLTIENVPPAKGRYDRRPVKFTPRDQTLVYQDYMSRIMSGMDFARYGEYPKMFMPINFNYESRTRDIYLEGNFHPNDGFYLDKEHTNITFDKFAETWFNFSDKQETETTPLEKRIGRAFDKSGKFLDAVGYNNQGKKKFMVNGVMYVKGDLDLSDGMDLSKDDCSGGVVLVDGDITLGNITRGEKIDVSSFHLVTTTNQMSPAQKYFEKWSDPSVDGGKYYIGSDKILTFVCLKPGGVINVTGSVLLGVQLVNFSNPRGSNPQITWKTKNKDNIIFYGSIACNRLELAKMLEDFGKLNKCDPNIEAPFFFYPSVMTKETEPPLAVQIMENMRSYSLVAGSEEYDSY